MAEGIKDTLKETGQKIVDGAKDAANWVKDKVAGHAPMGAADISNVKPHMPVIASCGTQIGKVDHLQDGAIKLTRNDSPDGMHHFIPTGWVARVDEHVHLNKNSEEAKRDWKDSA
jgi:hypothetical protein